MSWGLFATILFLIVAVIGAKIIYDGFKITGKRWEEER